MPSVAYAGTIAVGSNAGTFTDNFGNQQSFTVTGNSGAFQADGDLQFGQAAETVTFTFSTAVEFTFTNVDTSDGAGTNGTVFSGLGNDGFFSPTGTLQTNGSDFVFTPGSFVPVSVDPSTVVFDPVTGEAVTGDAVDFFANSGDQVDFNFINGGIDFINPCLLYTSPSPRDRG